MTKYHHPSVSYLYISVDEITHASENSVGRKLSLATLFNFHIFCSNCTSTPLEMLGKSFLTLVVKGPDLISEHRIKIAIWFQTSLAFGSEAIIRFER